MRIAILTSGVLPVPAVYGGAVENLIDYYLDYNNRLGLHDIDVYTVKPAGVDCPKQVGRVRYRFIDVTSLLARVRRKLRNMFLASGYYNYFINYFYHRCVQMMAAERYDLVLLENRPGFALDMRRRTDAKIVMHQHFDSLNVETYMSRDICRSLDAVLGVSSYICRRVEAIGTPVDTYVVHNGIDRELFTSATPARREDFGLNKDDFVMVFTGRVSPIKGIGELVHAMTQLDALPQVKLLVVGGSFYGGNVSGDVEFYERLRKEAATLGNRIVFTGFRPYSDIPSILRMCDLSVLPSTCQEAFGMTALEAMAAGVPILCTRSGGMPEICSGVARILEQGADLADRLRMNIADLYIDANLRQSMSHKGVERSKSFSKEQYSAKFLATLEQICS